MVLWFTFTASIEFYYDEYLFMQHCSVAVSNFCPDFYRNEKVDVNLVFCLSDVGQSLPPRCHQFVSFYAMISNCHDDINTLCPPTNTTDPAPTNGTSYSCVDFKAQLKQPQVALKHHHTEPGNKR